MLLGVVFVTGACVLVIEIAAVRILSPYYGNTIFSFSSVITVILAALSIGYYAGGRLADKRPHAGLFYTIIFASGFAVLALELAGTFLLPSLAYRFSLLSGPLIFSALLFFLPGLLLGMLSPFVITLQKLRVPEQGVGTVSGKVFFWSTAGSIAGSLSAGFVLIPAFGISEIMVGTGSLLAAMGMAGMLASGVKKERVIAPVVVVMALVGGLTQSAFLENNMLYEKDGVYEKIRIYETEYNGQKARVLLQDKTIGGGMLIGSAEHAFDYSKYYALYRVFNPEVNNALVIGGGAYTIPKALLADLPAARIDVVEIEPSLFELAQTFFEVPETPRLQNHVEDGRRFLADSKVRYDFIFGDAFHSLYSIPVHLTTKEFFLLAKEKLAANGVFMANFIGSLAPGSSSLILAEIKTFQQVFPNSYFFAVQSPVDPGVQNIIFVGYNSDRRVNVQDPMFRANPDKIIQALAEKQIAVGDFDLSPYPVFTDNYAPVEHFTAQVLLQQSQKD